ncbi:hypothetical protein BDZ91DRAFT_724072 [Kalaharituber pfeilii]|nr:hypothetical protein BDZ91DRAFT_724072 [Kalaharituber pfeilii]
MSETSFTIECKTEEAWCQPLVIKREISLKKKNTIFFPLFPTPPVASEQSKSKEKKKNHPSLSRLNSPIIWMIIILYFSMNLQLML